MAGEQDDPKAASGSAVNSSGAIDAMMEQLVESGESDQMAGLDLERLRAAMNAPGAAETVAAIQSLGANSQAGIGQRAPDFELPAARGDGRAKLSSMRGRPVVLIFGSFT